MLPNWKRSLPLLVGLYFVVLALIYAQALPIFEATDEAAHFLHIQHILETGELPVLGAELAAQGDADSVERWSYERHQPPLYYLTGALLVSGTQRTDIADYLQPNWLIFLRGITADNANVWLRCPAEPAGDTATAVWILRLYSLALSVGTLGFIYLAGKLAFGERAGLLAMVLVASIPMYISISASINNDNLVRLIFTAGVYWCLRMWRQRSITRLDMTVISLLLAGAALSKVTGIVLFGVVYLALIIGGIKRFYPWRRIITLVIVSLIVTALLAGWWYLRNGLLYGDLLANQAVSQFFGEADAGRQLAVTFVDEMIRVWRTFWFGLGYLHQIVYGPVWLDVYAALITTVGFLGLIPLWRRRPEHRHTILLLLAICAALLVSLIAGTRTIDISYGRILYPALVAFAPLLAVGWLTLLGRKLGSLLWIPLATVALIAPFTIIPDAYPQLQVVDSLPPEAHGITAEAESLKLLGYTLKQEVVSPGEDIRLDVYISGRHDERPSLAVTVVDSLTLETVGRTEIYPGRASTDSLDPTKIYRVPVKVRVDSTPLLGENPRQLRLAITWTTLHPTRQLTWTDADGNTVDTLLIDGPVWLDPAANPPAPQVPTHIVYGGKIDLAGYTLSPGTVAAGDTLTVTLYWHYLSHLDRDWTVSVGIWDAENNMIANADRMPDGYPTSLWQPGPAFTDTRTLTIPPQTPAGDYRLYVGWYSLETGERLPAVGDANGSAAAIEHDLYTVPLHITDNTN